MALPTNGRVVLDTTAGEIDIEIWSKECPKTCRNFIQLALEGYYDNVIFHRVVPGFLVQTGDKTGTGAGGESIWGEPFEDEIHPRLRFAHRGIVAMANNGSKNSNDSQFIITLDRADELQGKHTIFGRCLGDTIYNVMKIGDCELSKGSDRPVYPPKIKTVRILDNPYPDIIPRITAAEKRAQQRAKEERAKEKEDQEKRKGAKKNVKLLSFEDEEGGEPEPVFAKKVMYRTDLVEADEPKVTTVPESILRPAVSEPSEPKTNKKSSKDEDITKIREKHARDKAAAKDAKQQEINKLESEVRKLTKRTGSDDEDDAPSKKAKTSFLAAELAKYKTSAKGKGKKKDEKNLLAALDKFRGKLQGSGPSRISEGDDMAVDGGGDEEEGQEVDDDRDFMSHELHFAKDNDEEVGKAERDYEVIDPRKRNDQAKAEERERKEKSFKHKSRTARDVGGRKR